MQTFEHKYFGKVSFDANDDVEEVWEGQVDGINVTLWYDQGADVKEEDLDRFALFLENYPSVDRKLERGSELYGLPS